MIKRIFWIDKHIQNKIIVENNNNVNPISFPGAKLQTIVLVYEQLGVAPAIWP